MGEKKGRRHAFLVDHWRTCIFQEKLGKYHDFSDNIPKYYMQRCVAIGAELCISTQSHTHICNSIAY